MFRFPPFDMVLTGMSIMTNWETNERLTGAVRTIFRLSEEEETLSVKNQKFPRNSMTYMIADLEGIDSSPITEGRMAICFKLPKHQFIIDAYDGGVIDKPPLQLNMFLENLKGIIAKKSINVRLNELYNPRFSQYITIDHFDRNKLNLNHLSSLILENCVLSSLPTQIGHLPISYLSLTKSTLGTSQFEQDTFWNWMSVDTIGETLNILEMNSVGLETLPYEIIFLRKLETLSIACNKLVYLPHYIDELKELQCLFINDNELKYLPEVLKYRTFKELNFTRNKFDSFNFQLLDETSYEKIKKLDKMRTKRNPVCLKLSYLSFFSIIDNGVKFKRQEIPRELLNSFNVISRCRYCNQWLLPHYSSETFSLGYAKTINLIQNSTLPWQCFVCRYKCNKFQMFLFNGLI